MVGAREAAEERTCDADWERSEMESLIRWPLLDTLATVLLIATRS